MYTDSVCSPLSQEEVKEMVQREWRRSGVSDDPLEKLVAMGFGDRELNRQLLEKHDNQLQVMDHV